MAKKLNEELMKDIIDALSGSRLTGYQVYNKLRDTHPFTSRRLVYHYLKVALNEGKIASESVKETGKFSWGGSADKKYYHIKD